MRRCEGPVPVGCFGSPERRARSDARRRAERSPPGVLRKGWLKIPLSSATVRAPGEPTGAGGASPCHPGGERAHVAIALAAEVVNGAHLHLLCSAMNLRSAERLLA
jgi:hypothetical protein